MRHRAALIGCGKIGSEFADDPRAAGVRCHAQAYATCPDTVLVAVCDLDPAKARTCAGRWSVPAWYTDPARLLAEQQPEIMSICTPDSTHADLARTVLAAPGVRAVLVEKPLALSVEEGRELVALARERRVTLAVNYSRRYAASHQRLRDLVQSGALGRIQALAGFYTKGTLHNGTHWFDLVRFLAGPVIAVEGFDILHETGPDATLDARLEFACGASAYLHGCDADSFSIFECDLVGSRGRARLIEAGQTFEVFTVADSPHYSGYRVLKRSDSLAGGLDDALLHAITDLVAAVRDGHSPCCSGDDGLAALRIALAVRESVAAKRKVILKPEV